LMMTLLNYSVMTMPQVKSPTPLKSTEREFGQIMEKMIETMGRMYKNQTLKELNKGTVEKFEDAQVGNYAAIFLSLSKRAKRNLLKRFSDDRIEQFVKDQLSKVDNRNKSMLYESIGKKIGIDPVQLMSGEGLKSQINAYMLETAQWAKKLRDETLEEFTANSLRAMTLGKSLDEIMSEYDGVVGKRKDHAKFVARNQINNFNSILTKTRAQKAGITKAKWVTAGDERVRQCHVVRDGKEFDLDKGLYSSCDGKTLLPGVDYQCRCGYELLLPEDEE
jgi:SPP1 gp7 family putative phage head morphogenesis protein